MRIAYLARIGVGPKTGVFQKILRQIRTWQELGHKAKLFILTKEQEVELGFRESLSQEQLIIRRYETGDPLRSIKNIVNALQDIENSIKSWKPEVIFMREDFSFPPLIRLAKEYPIFMEINGNIILETWNVSKLKWLLLFSTRSFLLRNVAGFCFISWDLAELRDFRKYGKPFIVLGNGIDIERPREEDQELKRVSGEVVRLVFIGVPGFPWHGVDKIIEIAKANPNWEFDIIGYERHDVKGEVTGNVHLHGMMGIEECRKMLMNAHCAIDSLALHRKNMHEVSSLKTREYLKYGLPVILAHKDTDFPNGAEFLLQLPNTEDNVIDNMEKIREFVESWKGRRVPYEAVAHLDINVKEAQRIDFLRHIIGKQ